MPVKTPAPMKRDAVRTRAKILEKATHSFARNGFRGASLNEILGKAKVNKRMVYHYFGSKEGLYRAVHGEQWQLLRSWFEKALASSAQSRTGVLETRQMLVEALTIFHDFIANNQIFIRLLMWDGLEGGRVSRSLWQDIRGPIYQGMEALVVEAQKQGVLSPEIEPNHLIVSLMGEISFYFAYANSLRDVYSADPLSSEAIQERKEQVMILFKKILDKPVS